MTGWGTEIIVGVLRILTSRRAKKNKVILMGFWIIRSCSSFSVIPSMLLNERQILIEKS